MILIRTYNSITLIAALLTIFVITSCSENVTYKMPEYMPLKIGSSWTYNTYLSDSTFTLQNNPKTETEVVAAIDTIDGRVCYGFNNGHSEDDGHNHEPGHGHIESYKYTTDNSIFVYSIFNPFAQVKVWNEQFNLEKEITISTFDTVVGPKENLININFKVISKPLTTSSTFIYKGVTYKTKDFETIMKQKRTFLSNSDAYQEISNISKVSFVDSIGMVRSLNKRTSYNKAKGEVSTYTKKELTSTNVK